jgi:demethylmenaquinone methyltransferase/2-methoxy-6-polyprenyl-1,4-benzoquinol methylase
VRVPTFFAGRRVFEVACGTGYWTQHAASTALAVEAIDLNEETLAVARHQCRDLPAVRFHRSDAYAPASDDRRFDAGLAGFWLSHVDVVRLPVFLAAFHSHLEPDAPVLMFDERLTEIRRPPASRTDATGNRYELRKLQSGERFEIIKNFYAPDRLRAWLAGTARDVAYEELKCLWMLTYRVR